ncbi:MAG: VWA domain-containing protein [Chloroflexi bacterium]|nr:VWA domain-containing protein [Chloroflexota bacterium]
MTSRFDSPGDLTDITDLAEFVENPEPRCPCILVLDCSYSMSGPRIQALNDAVEQFKDEVCNDQLTAMRAEVAVIAYSHEINVVQDFVTVQEFNPPRLVADGGTRIAGAINASLDLLEARKETYRVNGIEYFRPIALLITDGYPEHDSTDDIAAASERVKQAEQQRAVAYFAFGVDDADMNSLSGFMAPQRPPRPLRGAQLKGIFQWLANSVAAISQSQPGMNLELPSQDQYLSY